MSINIPENIPETDVDNLPITRGRFNQAKVHSLLKEVFSEDEIDAMKLEGVDKRMVFGINPHYYSLACGGGLQNDKGEVLLPDMPASPSILALVMPRLGEALDMSGQADPSGQMDHSPDSLKGKILHKYDEIVLGHTALACSAHCRYCYRLDLFNQSTGKGLVKPEEVRDYIVEYNKKLAYHNGLDSKTGEQRYPVRELLLSGGDPMVMPNRKLYGYLAAAGESGVNMVRIGTKEMAFRPQRFDEKFVETLRIFNQHYPNVHVNIVTHFSHPDEFLERDQSGAYVKENHYFKWLDAVKKAVQGVTSLSFVSLDNQTPMIARVNDNSSTLHLLHEELRRNGIKPKYTFQCREIEGHKAFAVPVEKAWQIHTDSQKGLSDAARSRISMSTEWGKLEVVSVIEGFNEQLLADMPVDARDIAYEQFGNGLVVLKIHRSPHSADSQGDLVIARRNPKALWISDYEDRIIYDGRIDGAESYTGLLTFLASITNSGRNLTERPQMLEATA